MVGILFVDVNRNLPFLQLCEHQLGIKRQFRGDDTHSASLAIENQLSGNGHRDSDRTRVGAQTFPAGD
ncbi:uncharacterized protein METZ01_LOCUS108443 [marine metagenome]|uniref:Uncharacterized protein n=1 Tax=marine metagenome TaxID=408172 RepID=A0A381WSU7_9ZZZZ